MGHPTGLHSLIRTETRLQIAANCSQLMERPVPLPQTSRPGGRAYPDPAAAGPVGFAKYWLRPLLRQSKPYHIFYGIGAHRAAGSPQEHAPPTHWGDARIETGGAPIEGPAPGVPDRNTFGSKRSKSMKVIDSKRLERDAKNWGPVFRTDPALPFSSYLIKLNAPRYIARTGRAAAGLAGRPRAPRTFAPRIFAPRTLPVGRRRSEPHAGIA